MTELIYKELDEKDLREETLIIKDGKVSISRESLPLVINLEGRKEYILKITKTGGLILNKKEE